MTGSETSPSFRLAYVPGVTPAKWVRIWNERLPDVPLTLHQVSADEAAEVLRSGAADAGFLRLPVDRTDLSAIPLYTETSVVVAPKDHLIAAFDEVSVDDLADEIMQHPLDDTLDWERPPGRPAIERPATTPDALELVAAGVGLLIVPQSLARLYHRRDLIYRTITGTPQSQVALSWREDRTTDQVEDFIGIVRGRTVNSSRGRRTADEAQQKSSGKKDQKAQQGQPGGKGGGAARGNAPAGRGPRRGAGAAAKDAGRRGRPRRRS
ncbi:LysR family substrate-binding domain-containing protein [Streptomyces yunnanensis]|uniref:LysR family substrate-binding domain-containing protein n=1 Tax=Streptomyces yunnanensis TaxID=156453 RepID=A0ABY8A2H2_9ACTN|nr:LysR family substrate-binding domain-containing protein [Streptomyces yunnanensis]WEB39128.1 LysR family substrate-binding domain-containing protein [Streptomyces yunnanensis]